MALIDNKITNSEVQEVQVTGKPKLLRGTVAENQGIFDAFASLIRNKFNSLIDDLVATNVPATTSTSGLMSAEDKTKLDGIANNAQVNVLEGVQMNGTDLPISNKTVNVSVPTITPADSTTDGTTGLVNMPHGDKQILTNEGWKNAESRVVQRTNQLALALGGNTEIDRTAYWSIPMASTTLAGAMSSSDKTKLTYMREYECGQQGFGTVNAGETKSATIQFEKNYGLLGASVTVSILCNNDSAYLLNAFVKSSGSTSATVCVHNSGSSAISSVNVWYQVIDWEA